jgi:hypothetical protein
VKASINTQLVRIELGISVDRKHGIGMDYIASAPATHPVTQAGCTAMTVIANKRINTAITVIMCVNNYKNKTNLIFTSAG